MTIIKQYVKDGRIIRELNDNKKIIGPTEEETSAKSLTSSYHLKEPKICIHCGSTFDYGQESTAKSCGLCKIQFECAECHEIKTSLISVINPKSRKKLFLGEKFNSCCSSECSRKYNGKKLNSKNCMLYCKICKKETPHIGGGKTCSACGGNATQMKNCIKYCRICEKDTIHIGGGTSCSICNGKEGSKQTNSKNSIKYCEVCQKNTIHIGGGIQCQICHTKQLNSRNRMKYCEECNKETWYIAGGTRCSVCRGLHLKYCENCGKETLHADSRCYVCNPWENGEGFHTKYCAVCKEETLHNGSRCYKCNPWEISEGFHQEYCRMCKKETLHVGSRCYVCDPWEGGFDREEFYKEPLTLIKFDSFGEVIGIKDIDAYKDICGVWAIETESGEVLDVCKTIDIGKEMSRSIRIFGSIDKGKILVSRRGKKHISISENIPDGEKVVLKLIAKDISEEEAWLIEAQYAHDNKAKYWSPEPGQNTKTMDV